MFLSKTLLFHFSNFIGKNEEKCIACKGAQPNSWSLQSSVEEINFEKAQLSGSERIHCFLHLFSRKLVMSTSPFTMIHTSAIGRKLTFFTLDQLNSWFLYFRTFHDEAFSLQNRLLTPNIDFSCIPSFIFWRRSNLRGHIFSSVSAFQHNDFDGDQERTHV